MTAQHSGEEPRSMDQQTMDLIDELDQISDLLRNTFVEKDELVELLVTCAIAQEHMLIVGPPGTAKSEIIKHFSKLCDDPAAPTEDGHVSYFEYLLTRFTEPNEIFGPVNIAAFQEGKGVHREAARMLPRAEIAFLDEVFKANSAILNSLLGLLNERVFYNGDRRERSPLICAIGATNTVPEDEGLAALYDRFLVRAWTQNVSEPRFPKLINHGWRLEKRRIRDGKHESQVANITNTNTLRALYSQLEYVELEPILGTYREVVRRIRGEGITMSDRRVLKLLKLIAASALRHKRMVARPPDLWVLRHVWNAPDQIVHLHAAVDPYVGAEGRDDWGAERKLATIADNLQSLRNRAGEPSSDDYADVLQQLGALGLELGRHSSGAEGAPEERRAKREALSKKIDDTINDTLAELEKS